MYTSINAQKVKFKEKLNVVVDGTGGYSIRKVDPAAHVKKSKSFVYDAQTDAALHYTVTDLAAVSIQMERGPTAAMKGNVKVHKEFVERTTKLIQSFLPGSVVTLKRENNAPFSRAFYSILCPK